MSTHKPSDFLNQDALEIATVTQDFTALKSKDKVEKKAAMNRLMIRLLKKEKYYQWTKDEEKYLGELIKKVANNDNAIAGFKGIYEGIMNENPKLDSPKKIQDYLRKRTQEVSFRGDAVSGIREFIDNITSPTKTKKIDSKESLKIAGKKLVSNLQKESAKAKTDLSNYKESIKKKSVEFLSKPKSAGLKPTKDKLVEMLNVATSGQREQIRVQSKLTEGVSSAIQVMKSKARELSQGKSDFYNALLIKANSNELKGMLSCATNFSDFYVKYKYFRKNTDTDNPAFNDAPDYVQRYKAVDFLLKETRIAFSDNQIKSMSSKERKAFESEIGKLTDYKTALYIQMHHHASQDLSVKHIMEELRIPMYALSTQTPKPGKV
jgi:hypothetical protein